MSDRAARFDRADFTVRSEVAAPSGALDRLLEALSRARSHLLPAAAARLSDLFDRDTLLAFAFLLALWLGLQFTPVGWLADGVVTAAGLLSWATDLEALVDAGRHALTAETDEDLDRAAEEIAKALTDDVIDAVIGVVGGRLFKRLRGWVGSVRGRLIGRRFSGGTEKPLSLSRTQFVGVVRGGERLAKEKKEWEKRAEDSAWMVAAAGGVILVIGGAVYFGRRNKP